MLLWVCVIVLEALLIVGLVMLTRRLYGVEEQLNRAQVQAWPALKQLQFQVRQADRQLAQAEGQVDRLLASGGWKTQAVKWWLNRRS